MLMAAVPCILLGLQLGCMKRFAGHSRQSAVDAHCAVCRPPCPLRWVAVIKLKYVWQVISASPPFPHHSNPPTHPVLAADRGKGLGRSCDPNGACRRLGLMTFMHDIPHRRRSQRCQVPPGCCCRLLGGATPGACSRLSTESVWDSRIWPSCWLSWPSIACW